MKWTLTNITLLGILVTVSRDLTQIIITPFVFYTTLTVSVATCEGNAEMIGCENGNQLMLVSANFGRLEYKACPDLRIHIINCIHPYHQLYAFNGIYWDPCPGTFKYLLVRYRGVMVRLSIRFQNALYGLTLGRSSKVTPPPWYKGGSWTLLGFSLCDNISKRFHL